MKLVIPSTVEEFIETLTPHEVAKVLHTLELLETFGHTLTLPHSRHLQNGLLELRVAGKRAVRIFYCFNHGKAYLLHGFIKKTQQTPIKELKIARAAMNDLQ